MDKKTSFVLYPADFLAAVHNFKKGQIADLIVALCEVNFYGEISLKLSDVVKKRFTALQDTINKNNAKYLEICEKRQANGSKGGSKNKAKGKQNLSNQEANSQTLPPSESEKDIESEYGNESGKGEENKDPEAVNNSKYVGAPTVEEVAAYAKESGYTIDPLAFVKWNEERGWMNGKKYIGLDWKKAVRKWFCKENNISYSEMETMSDICADVLGKIKEVQNAR